MKTTFPDSHNLSHFHTAAAINSTLHYLRLQRYPTVQATMVELICDFLVMEREKILQSALAGLYHAHGKFHTTPTEDSND